MNNENNNFQNNQPIQQPVDNFNQNNYVPPTNNQAPTSNFEPPKTNKPNFIVIGIIAVAVLGGLIFGVNAFLGNNDDNSIKNNNDNQNNQNNINNSDNNNNTFNAIYEITIDGTTIPVGIKLFELMDLGFKISQVQSPEGSGFFSGENQNSEKIMLFPGESRFLVLRNTEGRNIGLISVENFSNEQKSIFDSNVYRVRVQIHFVFSPPGMEVVFNEMKLESSGFSPDYIMSIFGEVEPRIHMLDGNFRFLDYDRVLSNTRQFADGTFMTDQLLTFEHHGDTLISIILYNRLALSNAVWDNIERQFYYE